MRLGVAGGLVGIDLNLDAAALATEARLYWSRIRYFQACSLLTGRRSDSRGDQFPGGAFSPTSMWFRIPAMDGERAEIGWFITIFRAVNLLRFIKVLRAGMADPFVQKDAPISIARSFVPEEWRSLCRAAGLKDADVEIFNVRPAGSAWRGESRL